MKAVKSLKQANEPRLWLVVAVNAFFLYAALKAETIRMDGVLGLFAQAQEALPVALGGIAVAVLNSLAGPGLKASLVFWRVRHVLPGHRAFSLHAWSDPRVDPDRLENTLGLAVPVDPRAQNATWYRLYKNHSKDVCVNDANRLYLFLRDYATMAAFFLVGFGGAATAFSMSKRYAIIYSLILFAQYIAVAVAARNAGVRLVTNVLALTSTELTKVKPTVEGRIG